MKYLKILKSTLLSVSLLALGSPSYAMMSGQSDDPNQPSKLGAKPQQSSSSSSTSTHNVTDEDILQTHKTLFYGSLTNLKPTIQGFNTPSVFISYSWDSEKHQEGVKTLANDLVEAGIPVGKILFDQWANRPGSGVDLFKHADKIGEADKVILVGSVGLKAKYENRGGMVSQELNGLRLRIKDKGNEGIIPVWFEGGFAEAFPGGIQSLPGRPLGSDYHFHFFTLLEDIFQAELDPRQNAIKAAQENFKRIRGQIPQETLVRYSQKLLDQRQKQTQEDQDTLSQMLGLDEKKS